MKYEGDEATPDTVVGVTDAYLDANAKQVAEGRFINEADERRAADVVVIGCRHRRRALPVPRPDRQAGGLQRPPLHRHRRDREAGRDLFESTDAHVYLPFTTFDHAFPWVEKDGTA